MRRRICAVLALLCLLAACRHRPTYETVEEKDIAPDSEARLLAHADKESAKFDTSGFLYEDNQLETYVNGVAAKLLAPVMSARQITVKVVRDPVLNAFAYPNGKVYVNTGFLAAMDNEAQLADLLGHEMTHVLRRHTAREFMSMKKKSAGETGFDSLRKIVNAANFYSRTLETEADREGLSMIVRAGYDPRESITMYELMKKQTVREKMRVNVAYGDHPAIQERLTSTTEIVSKEYPGRNGRKGADEYASVTTRLLLDNAELDIKRANYDLAKQGLEKYLARKQKDARAYFLFGELYREKGPQHSGDKARESYRKALGLRANYAEAYRGLGMLEFAGGNKAEARKNFQLYLELQPTAADSEYIKQYIRASK